MIFIFWSSDFHFFLLGSDYPYHILILRGALDYISLIHPNFPGLQNCIVGSLFRFYLYFPDCLSGVFTSYDKSGRFRGQSVLRFERRGRHLTLPKPIVEFDINRHDIKATIATRGSRCPFVFSTIQSNRLKIGREKKMFRKTL